MCMLVSAKRHTAAWGLASSYVQQQVGFDTRHTHIYTNTHTCAYSQMYVSEEVGIAGAVEQ